jgi:hypothetical protein
MPSYSYTIDEPDGRSYTIDSPTEMTLDEVMGEIDRTVGARGTTGNRPEMDVDRLTNEDPVGREDLLRPPQGQT